MQYMVLKIINNILKHSSVKNEIAGSGKRKGEAVMWTGRPH